MINHCSKNTRFNTYQAINDVVDVRVVAGITALAPDELHDLVFSFPGDAGVRNDDLELLPISVRVREGEMVSRGLDIHPSSQGQSSSSGQPSTSKSSRVGP